MRYFYTSLIRQIPRELVKASGIVSTLIGLGLTLLAVFNRQLAKYLALTWQGVSPWLATVPTILVLAYLMAKANYDAFTEIGGIPDPPETRRRFHRFFHGHIVPTYNAARQLLDRLYGFARLYAEKGKATDSVTHFAIIEPADIAYSKVTEALESSIQPVQFVGAEFLLAYRRMVRYINLSLDEDVARTAGVTRQDPQVANWQQLHEAFWVDVKALLNEPEFSIMRKIVRGE